jgi:tRNA U34 5-carboxymethylaminomethyl modifying GTPase MnmE/TrmE
VPTQIEIHGIPLTLVDTAGLRATDDPIETLGIERTWAAVARADLALVMVDAAAGGTLADADTALLAQLPPALPRLVVHNKIDLAGTSRVGRSAPDAGSDGAARPARDIFVSAKTGAGIELLQQEILAVAGAHEDMEDAFLARERHLDALRDPALTSRPPCGHFAGAEAAARARRRRPALAHTALAAITEVVHVRRSAGSHILPILHRQMTRAALTGPGRTCAGAGTGVHLTRPRRMLCRTAACCQGCAAGRQP